MKKHQGKAVVERCQKCAACQEWLLTPSQAPPCARLVVMFPNGDVANFGTERKAYRTIEKWFREDAYLATLNDPSIFAGVGTIEWRHGTCTAPVLRRTTP